MEKHITEKRKREARIIWLILSLAVMAIIFAFSSQSTAKSETISDSVAEALHVEQTATDVRASNRPLLLGLSLRKMAHVFLFFCLGVCLYQAMEGRKLRPLWAVGLGYLYAVFDEVHQVIVGRYGRWQDTITDLAGILLGVAFLMCVQFACRKWLDSRNQQSTQFREPSSEAAEASGNDV